MHIVHGEILQKEISAEMMFLYQKPSPIAPFSHRKPRYKEAHPEKSYAAPKAPSLLLPTYSPDHKPTQLSFIGFIITKELLNLPTKYEKFRTMIAKLSPGITKDGYNYFFSLLTDRFEPLSKIWTTELEKKFNKKFKPIYILPFKHNKLFKEDNYVVLNKRLFSLHKKLGREDIINLIYPEDLNKQFCESPFINSLTRKLLKKQGRVFILSFTNVWLNIKNPNIVLLGPKPKVAERFDDKVEHIKTFKKLNLPVNKVEIYQNFKDLKKKRKDYPFFLSATFSSGGFESKIIYTSEDLKIFYLNLRPINKKGSFIAASLIKDIVLAPNTNAIVIGKDDTKMICVSDQIMRDNRYMGNIYPSKAKTKHLKIMQDATIKIGNYLSGFGFRGIFGCDFLITKQGKCFVTDLNPRRQGGYFCNVFMSKKINIIELEMKLVLEEKIPEFRYEDFQVKYSWAHSKLVPYFNNMKILKEFKTGNPNTPFEKIGSVYKTIYYPKGYILLAGNPGFYLTTENSYQKINKKIIKETEKLISTSYGIYEGI